MREGLQRKWHHGKCHAFNTESSIIFGEKIRPSSYCSTEFLFTCFVLEMFFLESFILYFVLSFEEELTVPSLSDVLYAQKFKFVRFPGHC